MIFYLNCYSESINLWFYKISAMLHWTINLEFISNKVEKAPHSRSNALMWELLKHPRKHSRWSSIFENSLSNFRNIALHHITLWEFSNDFQVFLSCTLLKSFMSCLCQWQNLPVHMIKTGNWWLYFVINFIV